MSMPQRVVEKNIMGLAQMVTDVQKEFDSLKMLVQLQGNQIRMLGSELANLKQLNAHLLGRGMGSTVHKNGG
jgi:predicted RNase H-like nuclease (RuvC/YqgF family)